MCACHTGGLTITSPSRNEWRERLVKRCRAPEERSPARKQRVVVEKGSRPQGMGPRTWRKTPPKPTLLTLQGGPCHTLLSHPLSPQRLLKVSAPPPLPVALLCPDRGGPTKLRADLTLPGQQERRRNRGKQGTEPSTSPRQALDRPLLIHLP